MGVCGSSKPKVKKNQSLKSKSKSETKKESKKEPKNDFIAEVSTGSKPIPNSP